MEERVGIPVIDLFAGPGGLGEGFSRALDGTGKRIFRVVLSVESDEFAHKTLLLRSFYRQFPPGAVPRQYFDHLRGTIDDGELANERPQQWRAADKIAFRAVLGSIDSRIVDQRIEEALKGYASNWVLIGGPPCQAYSLVGRARNGPEKNQGDARHFLYTEYLRILKRHRPVAFVIENVKGLLSARVKDDRIIERILNDLETAGYTLRALSSASEDLIPQVTPKPIDFVVRSEDHGVPQARHRLIIVGTRDDARLPPPDALKQTGRHMNLVDALRGLPKLRSALSGRDGTDSNEAWATAIQENVNEALINEIRDYHDAETANRVKDARDEVQWLLDTGGEFIRHPVSKSKYADELWSWYYSPKLRGVCNHQARSHIAKDLARYLFAASFAEVHGRSPSLHDFPSSLLPNHRNVNGHGLGDLHFADRFRVQLADAPSATVVAHICKDGHYFIHPDPTQCRSLTVREAARLQTFPDDYLFKGPRTEQYRQVGNAVPPYLAKQIAEALYGALSGKPSTKSSHDRQPEQEASKLEHVTHQGA